MKSNHTINYYEDLFSDGVAGRGVLVRSDLNVPLDGARITDDGRIRASVPTIRALSDAGARVVVIAHLGRPKNGPDPTLSMGPVAARLGELLEVRVRLTQLADGVPELSDGDVTLCENVRFDPRETSKDDAERGALAAELTTLVGSGGAFVSDGFGVVHRKQASVYDVATLLPAYAGGLVRTEVEVLRRLTRDTASPYVVVLGGSKVSDKLGVIEALLPSVDSLLVGGGMCFTFLAAQGQQVGDSLLQEEQIENCRRLLDSGKIVLPTDVVVADNVSAEANTRTVAVDAIEDGWSGLDIGPESVASFAEVLSGWGCSSWLHSPRAPGAWLRPRWTPARSPWSAAATRRPPCERSGCRRTASRTSRPVAGHHWSTSRASGCPASPCWSRDDPRH